MQTTAGESMVRWAAGALLLATASLVGCSGQDGHRWLASPSGECSYDRLRLLPALEAAMPSDATVRMEMAATGGDDSMSMSGVLAYTPTGPEMEMSYGGPEPFTLVAVDGRLFINEVPGGEYFELDLEHPEAAELADMMAQMDVSASFDAWRAGLRGVRSLGPGTIVSAEEGREDVCHYVLEVDFADAAAAAGEKVPRGAPERIDYDLYVTADDLIRRVTFTSGPMKATMDMTKWNEPVDIRVPSNLGYPEDEV
ncbi:hypothetical protein ACLM5J_11785 [Nocardioides sp. Bht2]|uniref:hypothetical protein n=1 Tax=Nocardioides sp. Bht2 TaxID=3392297 RepID=UPI0039B4B509